MARGTYLQGKLYQVIHIIALRWVSREQSQYQMSFRRSLFKTMRVMQYHPFQNRNRSMRMHVLFVLVHSLILQGQKCMKHSQIKPKNQSCKIDYLFILIHTGSFRVGLDNLRGTTNHTIPFNYTLIDFSTYYCPIQPLNN